MTRNYTYMTREGYERLKEQLGYLKSVKRREITLAIKNARELGDLKENAEYHAAREAMAQNEKKVAELEENLSSVKIIEEQEFAKDEVLIGATVKLINLDSGDEFQYTLLSELEADFSQGKISVNSPVAKGLMGKKENDIVEIKVPKGIIKYKILKITR